MISNWRVYMNRLTIDNKKYVLLKESEYESLIECAPPVLPAADSAGNRPAAPFMKATIARTLVRDRKRAGLLQKELADAAGIRV